MAKYRKCDMCGKLVEERDIVELEYKAYRIFGEEPVRYMSDDLCRDCVKAFYCLRSKLKDGEYEKGESER